MLLTTLCLLACLSVSHGQFNFQEAQNWVQFALKTQQGAANGTMSATQFFDALMFNDTEIWLPEVTLPSPYPAQHYFGSSLFPGVQGFLSSIPQAPWNMSFVQFGATVVSDDTAWITGAERWLLNGAEVRSLPLDAVQGRSYLVKYHTSINDYRFRAIQVYPLQCSTADCNRPAVAQASTSTSHLVTATLSSTTPASAVQLSFSAALILMMMVLI